MTNALHSIHLYTSDLTKMSTFLTDVFDMEVTSDSYGQLSIELANLNFIIVEQRGLKVAKSISPFVVLSVESEEVIKNLHDKYNFYLYRNNLKVLNTISEKSLIIDPDGRTWAFKVIESNHPFSSSSSYTSQFL
jgi:hypothetical protein